MLAIVMLLGWSDYSVGLWGWCLLRGYNVTFGQLVNPLHPYAGKWPPAQIPAGQVFPGKQQAGSPGSPGSAQGVSSRAPYVPATPGKCSAGFTWNAQLSACVPKLGAEH